MGKKLTALQIATYIANSESPEEVILLKDYLNRHPSLNFYAGKLLNEHRKSGRKLLSQGYEAEAEECFRKVKREPYAPAKRVKCPLKQMSLPFKNEDIPKGRESSHSEAMALRKEVEKYLDSLTPDKIAEEIVKSTSDEIQFFYLEYLINHPEKRNLVAIALEEDAKLMGILFDR